MPDDPATATECPPACPFTAGQLVRLKSGGPTMTVSVLCDPIPGGCGGVQIDCVWFDGCQLQAGGFNSLSLEVPPDAAKVP